MSIVARGLGLPATVPIVTGGVGNAAFIVIVPGRPAKIIPSLSALTEMGLSEDEVTVLEVTHSVTAIITPTEEVHTMVLSEAPTAELELSESPLAVLEVEATDC